MVNNLARWDGTNWSALGSGTDNIVSALAFSGNRIYAGGGFKHAGNVFSSRAAYAFLAPPPAPAIMPSGNNVLVSWPNTDSFTLQQSSNLAAQNGWTTSGYPVSLVNGTNSITVTNPLGTLFFRLSQP